MDEVVILDLAELGARIERRLTVDAEGAAVRAALGTWRDETQVTRPGVIHARHLPNDTRRPANPFIAYREGPLTTIDVTIQVPIYQLFVYDSPSEGYWRINKLIPLISRAYSAEPRIQVPGAVCGPFLITAVSSATGDDGLGLNMRYLTLAVRALT